MNEYRTVPRVEDGFIFKDHTLEATSVVDYQPGNGTRYRLVVAPIGRTAAHTLFSMHAKAYLVHWEGHGTFILERPTFLDWRTIARNLECNKADAVVLTEAIGHLIGVKSTTTESATAEDQT